MADDPRQDGAGPHVRTGEADAGEQEGRLGGRRAETDVGGHGKDRACARAHAVDRRDDRLRAVAHRLDEIARHPGEGEQAGHVHPGQRADDLVHVAARAEVAPRTGDHHRLDVGRVDEVAEHVAQLGIGLEGQRILPLGPVQRHRGDLVGESEGEMLRREAAGIKHRHGPSSHDLAAGDDDRLSGHRSRRV
jgi:hypothetical protein